MDQLQTKRSLEYSTENYKIEVSNLPKRIKYHAAKQILENYFKLTPHKIKVGPNRIYAAFRCETERDDAINKINDHDWKGRTLTAKLAAPRQDPFINRDEKVSNSDANKVDLDEEPQPTDEQINCKVCPLWEKPYEEQLKFKEKSMRQVLNMRKGLSKMFPNLRSDAPALYKWSQYDGDICCKFDGIISSPVQNGYRNKCEFNISSDGTVGFRMGRYRNGSECVLAPPPNCPIINETMFKIHSVFQSFLKGDKTKLKGYSHVTHLGNVRQLTLKTNENKECMVIIDINPQDLSEKEMEEELQKFIDTLKSIEQVVSIYFNISDKEHYCDPEDTLRLGYGHSHLYEYLSITDSPLKFRIGPNSFFQVNTKAAEILYKSIIDLAELNSSSLVLDMGCGTGTISLSLARLVDHVVGVEVVKSAIEDAKMNALQNNITNVLFFCGRAEELISESIAILKGKQSEQKSKGDIVAIVDPPRVGFNNSFIKTLRASSIQKIIYVACDPFANTNLVSLCRPKSKAYQGDPFVPTRAKAFDLFPHTKFCELVLVYERMAEEQKQECKQQNNNLMAT